jgi:hypothetical protein
MFIVLNEFGLAWEGQVWGWKNMKRFMTVGSAVRALQEAGEDIDQVSIVEDPFVVEAYVECA